MPTFRSEWVERTDLRQSEHRWGGRHQANTWGQGIKRQPHEEAGVLRFSCTGIGVLLRGSMLWRKVQSGSDDVRVSCLAPLGSQGLPVQVPPAGNEAPAGPIRDGEPFGRPARSPPFERF